MPFKKGHQNYNKPGYKWNKEQKDKRKGKNNPIFNEGVIDKVRTTINQKYEEGTKMGFQNIQKVRTQIFYPKYKCEECGSTKSLKVHHIDGNASNHLLTNLECLCSSCHISKHYQPYMKLQKMFSFEAAHSLKECPPCNRLHGHSFKLQVEIGGRLNKQGLVMNFSKVKDIVNKEIVEKLDHQMINDILQDEMPSAERLLIWMFSRLNPVLKGLKKITLWETENSSSIIEDKFFLEMLGE